MGVAEICRFGSGAIVPVALTGLILGGCTNRPNDMVEAYDGVADEAIAALDAGSLNKIRVAEQMEAAIAKVQGAPAGMLSGKSPGVLETLKAYRAQGDDSTPGDVVVSIIQKDMREQYPQGLVYDPATHGRTALCAAAVSTPGVFTEKQLEDWVVAEKTFASMRADPDNVRRHNQSSYPQGVRIAQFCAFAIKDAINKNHGSGEVVVPTASPPR